MKCCWKAENVVDVQSCWRGILTTIPSTRVTIRITRNPDKLQVDGMVHEVLKGGAEERCPTDNESADAIRQGFARSAEKSVEAMFS